MQPASIQALTDQAWALAENHQLRAAQEMFKQVCLFDSANAEAWLMRGSIHGEFSEFEPAIACLERAIALDMGYADAYLNLGKVRLKQGQIELALVHCQKAVECDPGFTEARMLLSEIEMRLGRLNEAELSCREALEHGSDDPQVIEQLNRVIGAVQQRIRLSKTPPIFVLGIPRSGTSMITGALHLCGAWIGMTVPGGPSNPEGFFENVALRERVLKPMLDGQGGDPLGVRALPDLDGLRPFPELKDEVLKHLAQENYPGGDWAWLYKGCKLTLVWPLWRAAFPDARWVIVRRPTEDIVQSCLRTPFMNQHSRDPDFWRAWVGEYEKRLEALKSSGVWWREIDSHVAATSDLGPIRSLIDELGLTWDEPSVRAFIKPEHWHASSGKAQQNAGEQVAHEQQRIRLSKTPPIFVLGIPRSGTSMITGALHLCGAWIGMTVPGGPSNPEGFFENVALRERVLKPMLDGQGGDPLGVRALPDLDGLGSFPELKDEVLKHLAQENYPGGDWTWLYKDCKLTLVWPLWRAAFPDARWVIVRRPTEDIVQSCLRTPFMNQHSRDPDFWRAWVGEYEKRLEALKSSGVWWREIDSHVAATSDLGPIRSLIGELGLTWDEPSVRAFIKPQHWHASDG